MVENLPTQHDKFPGPDIPWVHNLFITKGNKWICATCLVISFADGVTSGTWIGVDLSIWTSDLKPLSWKLWWGASFLTTYHTPPIFGPLSVVHYNMRNVTYGVTSPLLGKGTHFQFYLRLSYNKRPLNRVAKLSPISVSVKFSSQQTELSLGSAGNGAGGIKHILSIHNERHDSTVRKIKRGNDPFD